MWPAYCYNIVTIRCIRLDRLVIIILFDWLPFYRMWNPSGEVTNKATIERDAKAHKIWEDGCVRKKTTGEGFEILEPR